MIDPRLEKLMAAGDEIVLINPLCRPAWRTWAGHQSTKDHMADKCAHVERLKKIFADELIKRIGNLQSSRDVPDVEVRRATRTSAGD